MTLDPRGCISLLQGVDASRTYGKISKVVGLIMEGSGLKAPLGAVCTLLPDDGLEPIEAEVVGFRDNSVLLMPYGEMRGVKPGCLIQHSNAPALFPVGNQLLGRTLDAFGNPLDKKKPLPCQRQ
jgi:flagellum-specific ATP synthase